MGISVRFSSSGGAGTVAELPAVVTDVEAALFAALRRDEEVAADDLARALVNDLDLARAAGHLASPELLLSGGRYFPVVELAADHALAGDRGSVCVPFAYCVLRGKALPGGVPDHEIARTDISLVSRLRTWSDARAEVRLSNAGSGIHEGTLTRVTPDHLAIERARRELCVPWGLVREVQLLSLEDSG